VRIHLTILVPDLREAIGRKDIEVEFDGSTVNELIAHLIKMYGHKVRQALYDEHNKLDPMFQVLRNGQEWVTNDKLDQPLQDGDGIILMMMMAGG
jgi:MoaD family protein